MIGRGILPRRRPDQSWEPPQAGVAPGSKLFFRGRQVIVFGPTGAIVGIFVYAPGTTPGPGNPPIASITNGTKDPYGNAVDQGIVSYFTAAGTFAQLFNGGLIAGDGTHPTPANGAGQVAFNQASNSLLIEIGTAGANAELYPSSDIALTNPQSRDPATGLPEPWHALPLSNGWSAASTGDTQPQYRFVPWGGSANSNAFRGQLQVIGRIQHASTSGTSALTTALPAAYRPTGTGARWSSGAVIMTATNVYASSTAQTRIRYDSTGILELESLPSGTTNVYLDAVLNLDAGN